MEWNDVQLIVRLAVSCSVKSSRSPWQAGLLLLLLLACVVSSILRDLVTIRPTADHFTIET